MNQRIHLTNPTPVALEKVYTVMIRADDGSAPFGVTGSEIKDVAREFLECLRRIDGTYVDWTCFEAQADGTGHRLTEDQPSPDLERAIVRRFYHEHPIVKYDDDAIYEVDARPDEFPDDFLSWVMDWEQSALELSEAKAGWV